MDSDKNDESDVPAGWKLYKSKKNPKRKYYFNKRTGVSSWTKPEPDRDCFKESKCIKKIAPEAKPKSRPIKEENKNNLKRKSDGPNTHSSSCKKNKLGQEKQTPEKRCDKNSIGKKRTSSGLIKELSQFTPHRLISEDKTHSPPKSSPKNTHSPVKKCKETANTSYESEQSPNLSKNLANARLSQLRAELTNEANNEDTKARTNNQAAKPFDKTPKQEHNQNSTPDKTPKQEHNQNETQNTNSHSPNESAQSAVSPSQFFTANKIISSMKAQLQDRDSTKPKDAFADIEEGINNQTTEYPFMKHPATPPQFSEASKLISAINSKLCYRKETPVETPIFTTAETTKSTDTPTSVYNVFKSQDTPTTYKLSEMPSKMDNRQSTSPVSTYRSACDRMMSLRKRLSSEATDQKRMDTTVVTVHENRVSEAMDVDSREMREPVSDPRIRPEVKNVAASTPASTENVILVVDTNIFIHELDFIKNIMNSHIEGYTEQPTLLVPWRVINELDKLKDSNNGNGAICKRARPAMDYLYKALPKNDRIRVQPLRDANSHIYPCESPDDEILNCCLQQAERGKSVILLSNDKNLCSKAVANGVESKQLRALVLKPHSNVTAAPLSAIRLKSHIFILLSNILENEMRAKYNNLWLRVVFKPPPWTLAIVLDCLLKHWIAVFNEVFPRIEYLIRDLKNSLAVIEKKDPKTLTQSEVSNFKELCIETARRCQIIPEYMQLASRTAHALQEDGDADAVADADPDADAGADAEPEADPVAVADPVAEAGSYDPNVLTAALEDIWTVYSSYCAKLATALNIQHTLEDTLAGIDSLEVLLSKLPLFSHIIITLVNSMDGMVNAAVNSPLFAQNVCRLERALKESLEELRMDSRVITNDNLTIFCTHSRFMLQEARGKFTGLAQLLNFCKNTVENQQIFFPQ